MKFNKLYNSDCLDILPSIPNGSVDMVLSDPPYGTTAASWDKTFNWDEIWRQYWRILKPNGAVVLFSQMPFTARLVCSQIKYFRYEWIWEKNIATGFLNSKRMPLKAHENILVFYRKLPTYNLIKLNNQKKQPYYTKSLNHGLEIYGGAKTTEPRFSLDGSRVPRDVIKFATARKKSSKKGESKTHHPTEKPTELLRHMIQVYTNSGEVVLDNCMGSGSTCVAAVETGRKYIGIEKEKKYFDIACERVSEASLIETCNSHESIPPAGV